MSNFIYAPPQQPWLDIIYQDDAIIVLNKPSGLLSVPGRLPEHNDSIASRVQEQFPTATIVHRLDMCTSGVILMALTKAAQSHISRQFQQRSTSKYYYARLEGVPTANNGSIDLPLRCDWPNRPRQMVDFIDGKSALTHWNIISKQQITDENNDTYLESATVLLKPVTGRSHQLRVHMLALGTPILGDELYASAQGVAAAEHLQLHAAMLEIDHPLTEEKIQFKVKPPFSID
ncbi:RNA pseudouridine synthase [Moritella sp. 24]|uniref:pseudouridine synthase n=1 Tax=Moritella sp. 24 TaxID=2746230 RepID=UPI001BA5BDC5|nr:pseudouridine synthase [Moritella sp. 24]QUM77925.1 RNA pseudouridine synthase [Moritella sp. 24]